jgi:zinc protease
MRKVLFIIGFIAGLIAAAFSQDYQYTPEAELQLDPDVTFGKLDNGLSYYIRENSYPEDRAEFYLVVNAGAILENDDQDGLAHFCEHMAFNGTKNFEKKEIINYLQSIGMKFGPEINAFTSHDVTTYMLQKVPTDVPENIDTSLMILYDWANNIAFEDEEIDYERGVIHEEWRTRRSAEFRMMTKADKILYAGSKYAERDVIGDIDIIDNFEYEILKDFYRDWYRPDLQAIIAVGDFDSKVIEEKIQEMFGQAKMPENPREREYFEVPDHDDTRVTIQTDKEARFAMIQVVYKHDTEENKDSELYFRKGLKKRLYGNMLNARFQELLQKENPPFIYGTSFYSNLVRTKDAYIGYAMANDRQIEDALKALLVENERVRKYGFTETELERAKKEVMVSTEKQYKEREKQESDSYVWQYYSHFLMDDPVPGIEFNHAFTKSVLPGIKLEEVNALAKEWIRDENKVVVVMAPEKEGAELPDEGRIKEILGSVESMEIAAYDDKVSDEPLIPEEPLAEPVAKEMTDDELGATTWTFPNDVTVVIKPTDFKEDEIRMTAFSMGGLSLYDVDELMSANFAATIAGQSGAGNYDQVALEKKLAGKIVSVSPLISGTYEGFNGTTTPQDLESMLQLLYLYFEFPRYDKNTFGSYMNRYRGFLENKSLNPSSALWDTVMVTNANYHPRVRPMTAELLEETDFDDIKFIFNERFGDPSGFTFYFVGNIDPESARPLMEKYLGGLPKVIREESYVDNGIRPPEGKIEKVVTRRMEVPKSTVSITYHGEYDFDNFQERMELSALCDILDVRYVETVREEQGGTYGVGVNPSQQKYPYGHYSVSINFDCDPKNADKLKQIIYDEIELLKAEGPKAKDLNGVKENKIKQYKENLKKNQYWLNALKNMDYLGTDTDIVFNYEDYVNDLTAESLQAAAKKFFGNDIVEVILAPENIDDNLDNPMIDKP